MSTRINFGGVAGSPQQLNSGGDNYYGYQSYETMFSNCIIMNERLYYNIYLTQQNIASSV